MKIPFIDLQSQYQSYKQEIDLAIHAVLDSSQYIMGPAVKELELNLAKYTGAKHAVACASGTDALLIALLAIGIKPGDEIITTPFTFISSSEVISQLGAVPVFVDIEEDTYNINANKIEDKITNRTKAIIPVSLYGQTADMDLINEIANRNNLLVIEDAAQSFGALYKGNKSCNLSQIGCTSFFPSKPLGCYGDGGALFTSDDEFAEKVRKRHSTASSTSTFSGENNQKTKGNSRHPNLEEENPSPEEKKASSKTPQQIRKDTWLEDRKKQFGILKN